MKKLALSLFMIICYNIGLGCTCEELKRFEIWDYLDYTLIVKGKIISIQEFPDSVQTDPTKNLLSKFGGYQIIEVKVEAVYKGEYRDTISFKSDLPNGANCTKTINNGETWYIFSSFINGENKIGGCSWSQRVTSNPKLMRNAIKEIKEISSITNSVIEKSYIDRDCLKKRIAKGRIVNGHAEGYWEFLDKKRNPYMTGYYTNGVPDSVWIDYYRNEKEFALENIFSKTYYSANLVATISYSFEGEIIYGYCNSTRSIPLGVFTKREVEYLKTKAEKSSSR